MEGYLWIDPDEYITDEYGNQIDEEDKQELCEYILDNADDFYELIYQAIDQLIADYYEDEEEEDTQANPSTSTDETDQGSPQESNDEVDLMSTSHWLDKTLDILDIDSDQITVATFQHAIHDLAHRRGALNAFLQE